MLHVSWRNTAAQPPKRRRVSVEDLERGLSRLRLSCGGSFSAASTPDSAWATIIDDSDAASEEASDVVLGLAPASESMSVATVSEQDLEQQVAGTGAMCTAIVPFRYATRRRRLVRARASVQALCAARPSAGAAAGRTRIAVDLHGTAFVIGGAPTRLPLCMMDTPQQLLGKRPSCSLGYACPVGLPASAVMTYSSPNVPDVATYLTDCGYGFGF
mmetsp:Transcript_35350/g.101656  ORF Transcript_35350/g.101656 Transcript_35350/m.101656 type:complete len:215 (-) Transcript_35350:133-777(-)